MNRVWSSVFLLLASGHASAERHRTVVTPPPIVRVASQPSSEIYESWQVAKLGDDLSLATTANQDQSGLGVFCTHQGCSSFFNPHIGCEEKTKYPALVNSASSAFSDTLTCSKLGDTYVYALSSEKMIIEAMSIGGTLGVAFPMQSGEFKVSRFSLTGGARAYARAAQLVHASAVSDAGDSRL